MNSANDQPTYTVDRRRFIAGSAWLAVTAGLAGAVLGDESRRRRLLDKVSVFNDRIQQALFDPRRMAPTYPLDAVTNPFPFNAFYPESMAPEIDNSTWRLQVRGRVARPAAWDYRSLMQLDQESQVTRLVCIEGWSAVGQWAGVSLPAFLRRVGADLNARYVAFKCADDYWTSIDMASALHPQSLLATHFLGRPLTAAFGAPMRLRIPVKLGFKNPKHLIELEVTNDFVGGYWEQQGYNWFAGL